MRHPQDLLALSREKKNKEEIRASEAYLPGTIVVFFVLPSTVTVKCLPGSVVPSVGF